MISNTVAVVRDRFIHASWAQEMSNLHEQSIPPLGPPLEILDLLATRGGQVPSSEIFEPYHCEVLYVAAECRLP